MQLKGRRVGICQARIRSVSGKIDNGGDFEQCSDLKHAFPRRLFRGLYRESQLREYCKTWIFSDCTLDSHLSLRKTVTGVGNQRSI